MLNVLLASGLLIASAAAPTQPALDLDSIIRCVALDDVYWDAFLEAGAGERDDVGIEWRERNLGKAVAIGALENVSEAEVYARYGAIYKQLQTNEANIDLDDVVDQNAEYLQCHKKLEVSPVSQKGGVNE